MTDKALLSARSHFTDEELAVIDSDAIDWNGDVTDVIELAVAWASWMAKFDSDRDLPWEDHSVWTEHDLVGALHLRRMVQRALGALPAALSDKARIRLVESTDDLYRSFTVEDPTSIMTIIGEVPRGIDGWWWHREPTSGPIVRDVRQWRAILAKRDGRPG